MFYTGILGHLIPSFLKFKILWNCFFKYHEKNCSHVSDIKVVLLKILKNCQFVRAVTHVWRGVKKCAHSFYEQQLVQNLQQETFCSFGKIIKI